MLKALAAKLPLAGLTPLQIGIVTAIFFVTFFGALGAAYLFRFWNVRRKTREALERIRQD